MRRFTIFFGALICLSTQALGFGSNALQLLWDVPTGEVRSITMKAYARDGIRVEEVYYLSRPYKKEPVSIFGYYCYPFSGTKKLPAILLSHGGGGTASLPRAASLARRGYAVLAIDLPGKGENRLGSRSTGPNMDVSNLLQAQPDLSYNYLVHAVAAARNGITYLSKRKEVDPERIGMIGLSWGGVLTLLTNGQDKRLKAAVNVFGAGYIPEGCTWQKWFSSMNAPEKERWNDYLDPKNFLASQHAPILFITGTNDHCYYLPTFQKSYEQVKVPKKIWLIPNLRHKFLASAQSPALTWLDQQLKHSGNFPEVTIFSPFLKGTEKIVVPAQVVVNSVPESVRLYYAAGGPQQWTKKIWKEIIPHYDPKDDLYYFALPVSIINPEILFYVNAKDNRGGASSSLVRSLFSVKFKDGVKTFALSSPITRTYSHDKPITLVNGTKVANAQLAFSSKDNTYLLSEPEKGFFLLKSGK